MTRASLQPAAGAHRWSVFLFISLVYFFVYFHRVSTSVIATELLAAFRTSATALGFMSSMYFYLYALEQPLVGYLADRIGPRRVIGYFSVAAAAGCFVFASAPGIGWAVVGRALIGLGVGGVYVSAIKALSLWFRKNQFALLIGLLMSVGNLGAVTATTPLAWAAGAWGWRPTFVLIGGVTLILAIGTLVFTRDFHGDGEAIPAMPDGAGGRGARSTIFLVLTNRLFWIAAAIFFGIYGTLVTLQGLWATPFLMTLLAIDSLVASKLNMLIPVGVIIGSPLVGWINERFSLAKRSALIAILAAYALSWVVITFFPKSVGAGGLTLALLSLGVATGGFISTLWGLIRENTPAEIMGLTAGLLNPAPFLGVAIFQVITGVILDRAGRIGSLYPVSGFERAFSICLMTSVICLGLAFFIAPHDSRK